MERTPATVNLMLEVANAIERYPEQYNQETWGGVLGSQTSFERRCDGSRCIGGWAMNLHDRELYLSGKWEPEDAAALLGLGHEDWRVLFSAEWNPVEYMTAPEALRKIAFGADIRDVTDPEVLGA